jgi:hypothetical protein
VTKHCIRWLVINLTIFSPLIMSSNSSFCRILHNSFSFAGPYIFRRIFLSNTVNTLSFDSRLCQVISLAHGLCLVMLIQCLLIIVEKFYIA